ncbi:single-stranded DNA-binding protein [Actinotalea solisilvae]|uniref:single-stranded DNA-binding protein n=1 Tax=Actinotalea solisilvae TaxID=2072922 RepID=UPI0018F12E06|nr:single-stranded DNA-binding protein [Actinotalea solisilvae]
MTTQGLSLTVVGWVATAPKEIVGGGVPYTSFRIATTPRRFDTRAGAWADGRTEWITVKAFRDVAFNVAASVRKGDPLLVHGRLRTEEWESESGPRTTLVLEASALGHDLTRGQSRFARTVRVGTSDAAGTPSGAAAALESVDPWATDAPPSDADAGDEPVDGTDPVDAPDLVDALDPGPGDPASLGAPDEVPTPTP